MFSKINKSLMALMLFLCAACLAVVGIDTLLLSDNSTESEVAYAADPISVFFGNNAVTATEGNVYFDQSKATLTLNGATLDSGRVVDGMFAGISVMDSATIELKGVNTVTVNSGDMMTSVGVYVAGNLKITGDGSLNVVINNPDHSSSCTLYGILADSIDFEGGTVNVTVNDVVNDDDVSAFCTCGGGVKLGDADMTVFVPRGNYVMYDTSAGNSVSLAEGKGFSSAYGGATEDAAEDLTSSGVKLEDLQIAKYYYFSASVRTRYTVKHYVMTTEGEYSAAIMTETCYAKGGDEITLSSLKKSAYEVENGIRYASGKFGVQTASSAVIAEDGGTEISLFYERLAYALNKIEGAGTSFSLDNEGNVYYGASVAISDRNVDPDRYENMLVSVTYEANGLTVGSYDAEADTFIMPAAAVRVTSSATAKVFDITYSLNGGIAAETPEDEYTFGVGLDLPLSNKVTRTGYAFDGWHLKSDFSDAAITSVTSEDYGDKTVYAKWNALQLTCTLTEGNAVISTENGFDEGTVFSIAKVSEEEYAQLGGVNFAATLTSSECVSALYDVSLSYRGAEAAANGTFVLKLPISGNNTQVKLLVVQKWKCFCKDRNCV